jgi:CHAT domain-containing protein/Tfp pilus assembly protein PilF
VVAFLDFIAEIFYPELTLSLQSPLSVPEGVKAVNSIRHFCLIVAAFFALTLCSASLAWAQSSEANALNKRVFELYRAGKFVEAISLAQQVLAMREKALGPNHPDVAQSLYNLAALYGEQLRYSEAEPLYKRALAIYGKALGSDHRNVAMVLVNLASLYQEQGRYTEAESLDKRALAVYEKALGPDHPDVATALSNLAILYDAQGRYAEAEPLYKRALAIKEKALGPDHVGVAISLQGLAVLYWRQGRYAEAEPLFKRALGIKEKTLGPDHPRVATTLSSLALVYDAEDRYADEEPLLKRALAIEEKALGPNHPELATDLLNLAVLYNHQGRNAEGEPLYKRALAIKEKALGPNHPDVALLLSNLAVLYVDQGRYAEAESLDKRALAIDEKALGPDHPEVAHSLHNMAALYMDQGRYADAEPLFKRALAIKEKALGPDHADVANDLNFLARLYGDQRRYADALSLVRRTISNKTAATWAALPALFGGQAGKLISADEAIDDSLNVMQRTSQSSAGQALNALAVRFAVGNDRLAQLVRQDQDLARETVNLDKAIIAAVSKAPSERDSAAEQQIRDRVTEIAKQRGDLQAALTREFPDYAALSNPQPLTAKDIQALLADDEALVVVSLIPKNRRGAKNSYVWAITRSSTDWRELAITAADVSNQVSVLRNLLNFDSVRPFDTQASYALYRKILAPVEDLLSGKPRLSLVLDGALTSLPPQLLVTRDPTGKALKDVDWLIRSHAVTVLPSIASLKVLRGKSAVADAKNPLIGFANPVFDRDLQQNVRVAAEVTASRGLRGTVADIGELRTALSPLPDTADELRQVAASVRADPVDVILGPDATETRVKQEKLDQFRIVYFATHGLLAGDVADFAKLNAEPALVLSLPEKPTQFDDGLLTASEVAQLKLNADWVVLSACNTASGDKPGAEALSGLARAFFYAGGRSLLVSNWEVETRSAVALMVGTFAALAANPKLSHGEALQKAMLAVIENTQHSEWADPKYWAPFVVVGEPAKPAN